MKKIALLLALCLMVQCIGLPAVAEEGHTWNEGSVTKAATCTEDGEIIYVCTDAECEESKTEIIHASGHAWNDGEVTKAAACTEAGVKTFTCSVCGETRTEEIPASGEHAWDEGAVTKAATCAEAGVKTFTCSVCGETRTEEIPASGEHAWDEGTVTKEATAEEEGVKTFTCSVCGETRDEVIARTEPLPEEAEETPEAGEGEENPEADEGEAVIIPLAYLNSGAVLYQDEGASEPVGTLSAKAVVLILEEKANSSKVRYLIKEEGSEPELCVAWAKNSDLVRFTAEDLESWNAASHAVQAESEGYILEPLAFVKAEPKDDESSEPSGDESSEVEEGEGKLPEAEDGSKTEEPDAAEGGQVKEPEEADQTGAPLIPENTTGEVIEGVTALGSAADAVVSPEGEVLSSSDYVGVTDVLDAAGASTVFTIRSDGVITQYNGNDAVVVVPEKVMLDESPVTVTGIANTAFSRRTTITNIVLPKGITTIDTGCFKGCTALRTVNVPNTVTKIMSEAFSGCTSLRESPLTDSVTIIEPYAFYGCTSLGNVALPSSLTFIPQYAFYGCTSLSTITWPNKINFIGDYAFAGCTALTSLSLTDVVEIGDYAFANCTGIQNLVMRDGLKTIGTGAFSGCTAIKAINIPKTVKEMGNSVFENCSAAKTLSLSAACPEIKNFSFKGCTSLTQIDIPDGVTTIGREAFEGCTSLSVVYKIPASVTNIGNYAFNNAAEGCFFFVYNPKVVIGTDALGTNTNIFGYINSTAHAYANAHSGVTFYSMAIVDFVNRCYNLIHSRTGDVGGIIYWSKKLAMQELTGSEVVHRFMSGTEFTSRNLDSGTTVDILYKVMMDRSPDASGKAYWKGCLDDGMSLTYVIGGFGRSAEFAKICKDSGIAPGNLQSSENRDRNRNVTAFVSRCYKYIHGRGFDVSGLNYWTGKLLDGSSNGAQLVDSFIMSREFTSRNLSNEDQVEILYLTMQNRSSDPSGKAYWVGLMEKGMSIEAVVNGFARSPEFRLLCNRYGISSGSLENMQNRDRNTGLTEFVNRTYKETLGRSGEVSGLNYWTGKILNGENTPVDVAKRFLTSLEFQAKGLDDTEFVKTLYRLYMGREYDTKGLNYWLGQLSKGVSRETLMDRFGSSTEFTNIVKSYGLD